mmetsp:Transcript_8917/g.15488  ORF Transcript_8917/g.15488 Transcript_8917/m.15488 type:complete len:155 (-) Transcript_8917:281-745(-)
MKEASIIHEDGNNERDGNQGQIMAESSDDEDLCDVEFPIFDSISRTRSVQPGKPDNDNGNSHIYAVQTPEPMNGVDENSILCCFNMSVNAHIERNGQLSDFEPMPPKKNEKEKGTRPNIDGNSLDEKRTDLNNIPKKDKEWIPASLPLPSWAKP